MRKLWQTLKSHSAGRFLLVVLSKLYGLGFWLIFWWGKLFNSPKRLPCPVISVGNLTAGGTGKTLMTAYLAEGLLKRGREVCVLTRGYKGGDEASMLARQMESFGECFHVLAGVDRYTQAIQFLGTDSAESVPSCFILDDGHQHNAIHKDLSLVLINALDMEGLDGLLPYGLLREPFVSGLKRADAVVLTYADLVSEEKLDSLARKIKKANPAVPIFYASHEPINGRDLASKNVALFSGIGSPEGFGATVTAKLRANVIRHFIYEDHSVLSENDLKFMLDWVKSQSADALLTTAKDAARLKAFGDDAHKIIVIEVGLKILRDEEKFWDLIANAYEKTKISA